MRAYQTLEQMFALIAGVVRASGERTFVYAYWPDMDRIAHEYGSTSDAAHSHLAGIDTEFKQFLGRINGSDTLVIVTADHGIIDTDEEHMIDLGDHPAMNETLVLPLCGEPRVAYCYVRPDRRHDFKHYVGTELASYTTLWPSADLVAQNYFGLGTPHPRLRERIGDYTLIMKENFVMKDWLFGEKRYAQIGVHGGLSEQELYVPLIVTPC